MAPVHPDWGTECVKSDVDVVAPAGSGEGGESRQGAAILSSEQKPCYLLYTGDEILPTENGDYVTSYEIKIPEAEPISIMVHVTSGFGSLLILKIYGALYHPKTHICCLL